MDTITLLRVVVTVLSFAAFTGVLAYALSPRNARRFDAAARLVLEGDETLSQGRGRKT